jgi:Vacuolar-sorting-associated 13 protein C-terminal
MLGNPVGLFNKIGVGFFELAREPSEGMRMGTGGFIKGLGKGLGGMVKGIIGGTFESVSSLTGSLYGALKGVTWGEDERDKEDVATNLGMGLVYGVKGIGIELFHGVGGVFTKPYQGGKQGGIKGFSKGIGKGIVGLVVTPITATLRAG